MRTGSRRAVSPNSFSYSRSMEKQAIESERAELKRLSDSLDARKVQIEAEAAELNRWKRPCSTREIHLHRTNGP